MKKFILCALALVLTGCFGGSSNPTLPPELQGGALPVTQNPETNAPLTEFPPLEPNTNPSEVTPDTNNVVEVVVPDTPKPLSQNISCEGIVSDLEKSFLDINFCEKDSDCAVAQGSCPFGCYLFHSKALDFEDYQPTLDAYVQKCSPCEFDCAESPKVADIKCIENRCTDTRFQE